MDIQQIAQLHKGVYAARVPGNLTEFEREDLELCAEILKERHGIHLFYIDERVRLVESQELREAVKKLLQVLLQEMNVHSLEDCPAVCSVKP